METRSLALSDQRERYRAMPQQRDPTWRRTDSYLSVVSTVTAFCMDKAKPFWVPVPFGPALTAKFPLKAFFSVFALVGFFDVMAVVECSVWHLRGLWGLRVRLALLRSTGQSEEDSAQL